MMASFGFQADVRALQKVLAARNLIYQHQHNKQMSCPGKGCVFTYDVVGSYERVGYSSQGSGSTLIMPFLDNQLKSPSPLLSPAQCLLYAVAVLWLQDLHRLIPSLKQKFKNSWFNHDNIVTCSRDGSAIIWVPRSRKSHGKTVRWTRAYHLKVPPPPMPPQPLRGGPHQRFLPTPRGVNMIVWSLDNRSVLAASWIAEYVFGMLVMVAWCIP